MPSGYKKNLHGVGRKASRGGGSRGRQQHGSSKRRPEHGADISEDRDTACARPVGTAVRLLWTRTAPSAEPWRQGGGQSQRANTAWALGVQVNDTAAMASTSGVSAAPESSATGLCVAGSGVVAAKALAQPPSTRTPRTPRKARARTAECAICLEDRPLVEFTGKCWHHAGACAGCLRTQYVTMAQGDVGSYPLRCFHPACNALVLASDLAAHRLLRGRAEAARHQRLTVLARGIQLAHDDTVAVAHCPAPGCDHPALVRVARTTAEIIARQATETVLRVTCAACRNGYTHTVGHDLAALTARQSSAFLAAIVPAHVTAALESLTRDEFGINDGWGRCPGCRALISKGDGCSHMHCVCGKGFNWGDVHVSHRGDSIWGEEAGGAVAVW